jgi:6-pyruvoyltetrahydropterin/6-carboxytetrahydropterin synthase
MAMSRYQVIVEDGFSSAHALRHYHGTTEPLHGHNFKVQLVVEGKRLQKKVKYVADFIAIQKVLRAIVMRLDHKNINEVPPFTKENPSSENLARYIGEEFCRQWHEKGVSLESVTVWETPQTAARYLP